MRRIRSLTALCVALIVGAGMYLAGPARADAKFVGGGAAPVTVSSYGVSPLLTTNEIDVPLHLPSVRLPDQGSATVLSDELAGKTIGPITAHVLRATTIGNLQGNPYAASSSSIADLIINGTDIRGVSSNCVWSEQDGAVAHTQIVLANGTKYEPKPNTTLNVPGLGQLVLNEQHIHQLYVFGPTSPPANVIWVAGIRLHLLAPRIQGVLGPQQVDIELAFSSCDPVNLPTLSGIRLTPPNT